MLPVYAGLDREGPSASSLVQMQVETTVEVSKDGARVARRPLFFKHIGLCVAQPRSARTLL